MPSKKFVVDFNALTGHVGIRSEAIEWLRRVVQVGQFQITVVDKPHMSSKANSDLIKEHGLSEEQIDAIIFSTSPTEAPHLKHEDVINGYPTHAAMAEIVETTPRTRNKSRGWYEKYRHITRADGRDRKGGDRENSILFVMDLVHDPLAADAMELYATNCEKEYPKLAADIRNNLEIARGIRDDAEERRVETN